MRTFTRRLHNVARHASQVEYTPSIGEKLFGGSSMPRIPLDVAFPHAAPAGAAAAPAYNTTISTLPNGIRVATLPSNTPIASVGVFIDAGSRYETPESNGITHFLELMSLKSTTNRSDFRLVRDMAKLGANISASSGREHIIYSADCNQVDVPHIIGTWGDIIQHHAFDDQEIIEEREHYLSAIQERDKIMDLKLMESIHEAAYNGQGLGLSLYAPEHNLLSFNRDSLKQYVRHLFTPKRMVISAVGVEHDALKQLVQETFTSLPSDTNVQKLPAQYTGGEVRMHTKGEQGLLTHFALAFETENWHSKDLLPMCVLQMIMGGGGSFSAGGPGKGMYSRLYSNVLNKLEWAESCTCFNSIFTDSAIFGIYGTAVPDKARALVDAISKELIKMSSVTPEELQRAKNQLKSAVYMQLESRLLKLEDMGRQVMVYGRVFSAAEISAQIDQVSAQDIERVAKRMLQSQASIAAAGNLTHLPRYEQIQRAFK